jgi:HK97 family phage major capsid protein
MATRKTAITLAEQVQEAQAVLDAAGNESVEERIGAKTASMTAQAAEQARTFASEAEELAALRAEKRERDLAALADQMAAQAVASIKSQQDSEQERINRMVAERVQTQVAALLGGTEFSAAVKAALPATFGRKTPLALTEDQGERSLPAIKAGKSGGLVSFLRCVANKDAQGIREIYRAHGMKALVEGGGAGSSGSLAAGGALVPPEYSTEIIDLLRPAAVLRKAGPEIVQMKSPQYFRPRLATAGTAAYIGETVAITPSQETFDQVSLTAHKLAAIVPVSNELLRDSDPSVERVVRDDLVKVLALKEDIQFLNGTGSATAPTGLFKRSDIQTINPATNGDTVNYTTPLDMYYKLISANVPIMRPAWFCNPALIKTLTEVADSNGRPIFLNFFNVQEGTFAPDKRQIGMAGTLYGIPLYTTTQIPLGTTGSGNTTPLAIIEMSYVLIGNMADLYIDTSNEASYYDGTNTISLWQSDMTGFRAILRHDITLMQGNAVVVHNGLLY